MLWGSLFKARSGSSAQAWSNRVLPPPAAGPAGAAALGLTEAQLPEPLAGRLGDPFFGRAVALEPAREVLAHGLGPQRESGAAGLALAPEQADLSDATHAVAPLPSRLTRGAGGSGAWPSAAAAGRALRMCRPRRARTPRAALRSSR